MTNKRIPTRIVLLLLCMSLAMTIFPTAASADMGPKPSVRITFEGLGEELCYGTLLSKEKSTGPEHAWDGSEETANPHKLDGELWKAFAEYKDDSGFYFLQRCWTINETKQLAWTYYPPDTFKILLYFPESGAFVSSAICEKYAFDSYFTAHMENAESGVQKVCLGVHRSYDYTWEILSLVIRITLTILLELGIALLFGYRENKQLLLIGGVNAATQILLNVLLNIINYNEGPFAFIEFYLLFELIVFALEAAVFCIFLGKLGKRPRARWLAVFYALTANALSFAAGWIVARYVPGIF